MHGDFFETLGNTFHSDKNTLFLVIICCTMRSVTLIWIAVLLTNFSFSQENEAAGVLLKKANEMLYDDPSQTLKITEHLLRNPGNGTEKIQTCLLQTKSHLISGNLSEAIAGIHLALTEARLTNDKRIQSETYLLAAEIYGYLDLSEISRQYHNEAIKTADGPIAQKQLDAYQLFVADSILNTAAASKFLKNPPDPDHALYAFITRGTPFQLMARQFLKIGQTDSAQVYLEKNRAVLLPGAYWEMSDLLDRSAYFFAKKEYPQAIALLNRALGYQKIRNPKLLMAANQMLSDCYLALGDKTRFHEFRQKAIVTENELDTQTTSATNFAFENLQTEKKEKVAQATAFAKKTYWILGVTALVILLVWLFARWLFATRINHTLDIINYLRLIKKSEEKPGIPVKPAVKNLSIPKETEALLLSRLEKFEAGTKYLSKDISLAQMAALFDTNTKYLSEVINKYKGRNVNLYINELRIKYIVEKLKTDPRYLNYKVSYLAEECGFSSHSSFSAIFKSITGITPNVFIQFLTKDLQQAKPELV
jgi:AraC-like DNA-binding protein